MEHYSFHVLKPGYCNTSEGELFHADGTITLVTGPKAIIVDTGGPWDRTFILDELKSRHIEPDDIDYVICTHGHSDHVGNINLFPHSILIVGFEISRGDEYFCHDFSSGQPYAIDGDASVVPTPGHTGQDVTLVVHTNEGTVAIAGDLFENANDEGLWQKMSLDPETQLMSRERILKLADIIVPGHGNPFTPRRNAQK